MTPTADGTPQDMQAPQGSGVSPADAGPQDTWGPLRCTVPQGHRGPLWQCPQGTWPQGCVDHPRAFETPWLMVIPSNQVPQGHPGGLSALASAAAPLTAGVPPSCRCPPSEEEELREPALKGAEKGPFLCQHPGPAGVRRWAALVWRVAAKPEGPSGHVTLPAHPPPPVPNSWASPRPRRWAPRESWRGATRAWGLCGCHGGPRG